MLNKTGYRQMLRDRTPKLVNFALKWCKVKEAWLDHVYKNWIWIYVDNKERLEATRRVLGYKYPKDMKNKRRFFKFEDTIAWDSLPNYDSIIAEGRKKLNLPQNTTNKEIFKRYLEKKYTVSNTGIKEIENWVNVAGWVSWFCNTVPNIKEEYEISKNKGTDIVDIKRGIMLNYLYVYLPTKEDKQEVREKKSTYVNSLTDYLLDCFEKM